MNPITIVKSDDNSARNSKKNRQLLALATKISGKVQLAVPKLCGVKQRRLVMAIDPFGIQPMLLHQQLSDLATMGGGWWFKNV